MKRITAFLLSLLLLVSLCPSGFAYTLQTGRVVSMPLCDLAVVLPEDYFSIGSQPAFSIGYANSVMVVGMTPLSCEDLAAYHEMRLPESFATMENVTIGDREFHWFTPVEKGAMTAILLCKAEKEGQGYLELAFYPQDPSAEEANRKIITEIASAVRCRSAVLESDKTNPDRAGFEHLSIGLYAALPLSVVKMPEAEYSNGEIVIYQNEYFSVNIFGHEGTVSEYRENFGITDEYYISNEYTSRTGVHFYVFEPKDPYADPVAAYCVAEGCDGLLLELCFIPVDIHEEDPNWFYISDICSSISFIE